MLEPVLRRPAFRRSSQPWRAVGAGAGSGTTTVPRGLVAGRRKLGSQSFIDGGTGVEHVLHLESTDEFKVSDREMRQVKTASVLMIVVLPVDGMDGSPSFC